MIGTTPFFDKPLSNIPYYYQGKYVELVSTGEQKLIVQYSISPSQSFTFTLSDPFSSSPSPGDTFYIVTKHQYYATINPAFPTTIPAYPVYRVPIPGANSAPYTFQQIDEGYDDSQVLALRPLAHADGTVGMAVNTYSVANNTTYLRYYYADAAFSTWTNVLIASHTGRWPFIDAAIVDENPAVAFFQRSTEISYTRATAGNGSAWGPVYDTGSGGTFATSHFPYKTFISKAT